MQSKIKINHPQKAELQIATLLFYAHFQAMPVGNISFTEPAAYGLGKESAMTKHNAEMENSREQSRVCARLPLNLQLFAEDTGENGADTNAEGAAGSTGAGLCDCRYGEKEQLTAFWFLQSVHFRCPDDCLKTGLFCLSEYKILLLRYMMTDFG